MGDKDEVEIRPEMLKAGADAVAVHNEVHPVHNDVHLGSRQFLPKRPRNRRLR